MQIPHMHKLGLASLGARRAPGHRGEPQEPEGPRSLQGPKRPAVPLFLEVKYIPFNRQPLAPFTR